MTVAPVDIAAVIVTYNSERHIVDLLESIPRRWEGSPTQWSSLTTDRLTRLSRSWTSEPTVSQSAPATTATRQG